MLHIVRNKFSFPASWGRAFAVTLFFVTLSAGLFWLDYFRSYSAEVTILVISRPGVAQSSADISGNLAELTRTLSFYDRMLAEDDLIDDAFAGYVPDKRKKLWNDTVAVKKIGEGSVLSLRAVGDTPEAAAVLARQTARTLFSVAGLYYNVRTDIDLRIIDGPLVSYVLARPLAFGLASLFTGFFITALFFLLLNVLPGFIGGREKEMSLDEILAEHDSISEKYAAPEKSYQEYMPGETVPWIDPRKFIPAKPTTLSFENVTQGAKRSASSGLPRPPRLSPRFGEAGDEARRLIKAGLRAPAPANLPVAPSGMELPVMDEAAFPFEFETPAEEPEALFSTKQGEPLGYPVRGEHVIVTNTKVPAEAESASPTTAESASMSAERGEPASAPLQRGEPTVDEYKRRLNKLLSGNN